MYQQYKKADIAKDLNNVAQYICIKNGIALRHRHHDYIMKLMKNKIELIIKGTYPDMIEGLDDFNLYPFIEFEMTAWINLMKWAFNEGPKPEIGTYVIQEREGVYSFSSEQTG